jgi:1-acyl-sn-glycerol-3-phosphate acyltransferase
MSPETELGHLDLPRTDDVAHPATRLLHRGRVRAARLIERYYRLEQHHADRVPDRGPVVMVANHIGWVDGPLMAIVSPRPVHNLTKVEMFTGPLGRLLHASGQIPVRRREPDIAAIRTSLRVLRDGGAVGVFPEGTRGAGEVKVVEPGAAYLAIATGATVCPVIFLGTRMAGASLGTIPPRGARLTMTYGDPLPFTGHGWPRRRGELLEATGLIQEALLDTLALARALTGMELPGPAPEGEIEE